MLDPRFHAVCEAAAERWDVPALAVGVAAEGQEDLVAVGCRPDTVFRVASLTKPFTATLALALLDVDAETGIWPPDVRVRHLLSHTSGFDCECGDLARFGDGDDSLGRVVAELPSVRRWLSAGETWSYANAGYWLAGWLCAERAGATYEDALSECVVAPAALEATSFAEPDVGGTGPDATEDAFPRARRPSGGLVSTVADLLRFGRWQLAEAWTAAGRAPVAKPPAGVYGLGWAGERVGGNDVWGHRGSYGGFQSSLLIVPARGAVVVGLTNSGRGGQALREIEDEVFQQLLGARRRVPETVALEPRDLEAFTGEYAHNQLRAAVGVEDSSLRVDLEERLPAGQPGTSASVRARPIGPRTFEILEGDLVHERFDFPREGFVRLGGRLAERIA